MWDWQWQDPADYGERYDFGFFEATPSMMRTFYGCNMRTPTRGWVASALAHHEHCKLPPLTEVVDQAPWNEIGLGLGGLGATKRLQFTRGTIATCWAIESNPLSTIILVGFDNIRRGQTLPIDEAFSPAYRKNPGTFPFAQYEGGQTKHGNHDFAIELPVMRHLADKHGCQLRFAEDVWG
jgi:hypothetical protein